MISSLSCLSCICVVDSYFPNCVNSLVQIVLLVNDVPITYVGSKLLIQELPSILDGSARIKAQPQDNSKATLAPKINPEESWLCFDLEAFVLHNKVRAFAGWPGTRAKMVLADNKNGHSTIIEVKIITTRVSHHELIQDKNEITFVKGSLVVPCGRSTALEILEIQLPGKKVTSAAAFWNGLRGRKLKKL